MRFWSLSRRCEFTSLRVLLLSGTEHAVSESAEQDLRCKLPRSNKALLVNSLSVIQIVQDLDVELLVYSRTLQGAEA